MTTDLSFEKIFHQKLKKNHLIVNICWFISSSVLRWNVTNNFIGVFSSFPVKKNIKNKQFNSTTSPSLICK